MVLSYLDQNRIFSTSAVPEQTVGNSMAGKCLHLWDLAQTWGRSVFRESISKQTKTPFVIIMVIKTIIIMTTNFIV